VSLSFLRPLVHRYAFYPDSYVVPTTCKELLNTAQGDNITLIVSLDERLKSLGAKKYLTVKLEGVSEGTRLSSLESEIMGIYDLALLAECEQIVDIDSGTTHELDIDVEGMLNLKVVHLLDEYPRLSGAIFSMIEDLEDTEPETENAMEETAPTGPELKFVSVHADHSVRRRMLDVVALLSNVEDEDEVYDITVLSLSSEIAKTQAIAYEMMVQEIEGSLRGRRVSGGEKDELIEDVSRVLEEEGVVICYD
jgi:hypothetical protein